MYRFQGWIRKTQIFPTLALMHPHPRQNIASIGLIGGYKALLAAPHRFTFNGKESDSEVKGEGNSLDFGARILDPRLGRWLAVDPKSGKYPSESPFTFVGNNPIIAIDPDGEEKIVVTGGADKYNDNRMNFIMAAKNQILEYKRELERAESDEKVTWLILDIDYSPNEKNPSIYGQRKMGYHRPYTYRQQQRLLII
jgi:RHS repeat-associated protein